MYYIADLIELILYLTAVILVLRHYTHMLQLSSYQLQGYFRYLKQNALPDWLLLIALGGAAGGRGFSVPPFGDGQRGVFENVLPFIEWLLLCAVLFRFRPGPVKKKFVVTKRVRRLWITCALLCAVCAGAALRSAGPAGNTAGTMLSSIIRGVFTAYLPLVVALANGMNLPIERGINNGFIRDAQRRLKEHPGLRVIGVTGSFGKTSVKYYLTELLSEKYHVLMTPESYNTPMGVVRTIREQLQPTHEIFVCEMGARHVGDIREICDIVHPDDGIVTALGAQHLETFHSMENIIHTKYELFDAVERKRQREETSGCAARRPGPAAHLKWANLDNEIIAENLPYDGVIRYGTAEGADYRAEDLRVGLDGTTFTVTAPSGERGEFATGLVGRHNVQNIVGAIAAAHSFGVSMKKLRPAVRRLQGVPHRLQLTRHGTVSVLDDAYNSNPAGAKAALETLAMFRDAVKVLVTPGMVELGEREAEYNEAFGAQAAAVCDYIILVGDRRTQPIRVGIEKAGFERDRLFVRETFDEAAKLMYALDAGREKVILLENDLPDTY